MESNSETGPVLIALHWLDWPSVNDHRDVLERHGYLPDMLFNKVIDAAVPRGLPGRAKDRPKATSRRAQRRPAPTS